MPKYGGLLLFSLWMTFPTKMYENRCPGSWTLLFLAEYPIKIRNIKMCEIIKTKNLCQNTCQFVYAYQFTEINVRFYFNRSIRSIRIKAFVMLN